MKTKQSPSSSEAPVSARPKKHIGAYLRKAKRLRRVRMSVIVNEALEQYYERHHKPGKRDLPKGKCA